MIELLFRYLILFLGSCLRACRMRVLNVCMREAARERDFWGSLILFWNGKRNCVPACSLHKTGFRLISSKLILFTSDLVGIELQICMHWRDVKSL